MVERLLDEDASKFPVRFDERNQFDYSFHSEEIKESTKFYRRMRDVKPRKNRRRIPPGLRF